MAERASMTALIDLTARLAGDPANAVHSRQDVQDALDVYRIEARYEGLTAVVSYPGGVATYLTFDAAAGYWETDGLLYDAGFGALTPATSNWTAGRWTFAAQPAMPAMLTGWAHDPHQAAADLVEIRAVSLAEQYDFTTGPDSFKRSQKYKQLMETAARLRAMSARVKAAAEVAANWEMPEIGFDVFCY